jgi:hypothetical protein
VATKKHDDVVQAVLDTVWVPEYMWNKTSLNADEPTGVGTDTGGIRLRPTVVRTTSVPVRCRG